MKGQSFMLYLYAVFLLIVFVMMLTVGISGYFYKSKLGKGFRTGLNDTVIDYGIGNDKMRDQALDMLQANLVCCGVGSYEDWFSTRWANNSRSVPVSCCIHQNHLCRHLDIRGNNVSTISTDGCYRKVLDFVNSNLSAIGGGVLGIAFFQLFGVIFAYCLARNVNRGKYEPVD
ncbi:TSPAN7 (predicted) [Pycnogonum litorale]